MLSILIPTYNYDVTQLVSELHQQCIDSGIAFEIIVLDDGSETFFKAKNKWIAKFSFCSYIENAENLGRTLSREKLALAAKYQTLLFLDADMLPASENFIKIYMEFVGFSGVVFGGYAYRSGHFNTGNILRYKYGKNREERSAFERAKSPYGSIFSGNLLLPKNIFLEQNFSGPEKLYGMDIFFAYSLYKSNIEVVHIDNPVYHLGLEDNGTFFRKSLEAVHNRKVLLAREPGIGEINSLMKHYLKVKRYGLAGTVAFLFRLGEPLLKKMILKKDPSLFCLDLYRLGYICSIK